MEKGEHNYRFSFCLPTYIPSSFEFQDLGHIRYWLEGIIYIPWGSNFTTTRTFTLVKRYNLNQLDSSFRSPSTFMDNKVYGFGPFKSKPINVKLKINKSI